MPSIKRSLIIAPHVDDELIGCFTVMESKKGNFDVLYLYELSDVRKEEALNVTAAYGAHAYFNDTDPMYSSYDEIYIPRRDDHHHAHKLVNSYFFSIATHVYSVDMNNCYTLPSEISANKLAALNKFYPSQKNLWANDARYYLFENVKTIEDYIAEHRYRTFSIIIQDMTYLCKVPYNVDTAFLQDTSYSKLEEAIAAIALWTPGSFSLMSSDGNDFIKF